MMEDLTPDERLTSVIVGLDDLLTEFNETKDDKVQKQISTTLHWLNENIEKETLHSFVENSAVVWDGAIKELLDDRFFNKEMAN